MKQGINLFEKESETTEPLLKSDETENRQIEERDESDRIEDHLVSHIKRVVEALLFSTQDPITLCKIREITDTIIPLKPARLRKILDLLRQEYISQQHAFRLEEIAEGYVLRTHEEYSGYIELLYREKRGEKLSRAATEVLAIVAYRQPITRPQIDAIRGIDSSGTLAQLLERNLVEPVGKLEAPGRPTLFGTTKNFLKHFGLKQISDLGSV